jgi:carboxymethylenebutenolidase
MIETEVELTTPDGQMRTFVTRPDEGGPHPLVLFYMDAPGKREELHDMARRIATAGHAVMLPNLYYREVPEYELDFRGGPDAMKRMFELMRTVTNDGVVADTQALLDWADAQPEIDGQRVGCVGYCMSGPFALCVAAAYPERVRAAASVYGVRLAVDADDSPHLRLPEVRGELYVAAAETDEYAPPEMIEALQQAFDESKVNGRIEWYPGAHHGFAFPSRKGTFDKPSAERHWARLHSLFRRNLSD